MSNINNISKYLSEIMMFYRIHRNGPKLAGVVEPDILASHVVIASQVAYILAQMEGADPNKCAVMCLFHDNGEIRVNDQTKIGARYYDSNDAEGNALAEQISRLSKDLQNTINTYFKEFTYRTTKEAVIAKDADLIATAIHAKQMVEKGYKGMQNWIDNVKKMVKTENAKQIIEQIETMEDFTNCWWEGLKKI